MANHMIPFLWMHGEDEATLRELVCRIYESGIGDLCVESRPHPDFLGDKWWFDMDVVLDECEKHNMGVWILDDEKFPTGYAAGRAEGSPDRIMYLEEKHVDLLGPMKGASILLSAPGPDRRAPGAYEIVKVAAAKRIPGKNMDHSTHMDILGDEVEEPIDLTPNVVGDVAYWDIPEGLWRIFIFTKTHETGNERRNKYINPLTKAGTRILIDAVYESHYQRYKEKFGSTIKGFFSDEPQFGGGFGYHAMIGRSPFMSLPWCDEMDDLFSAAEMACLWHRAGSGYQKARVKYMDMVTRLYGENFCNQLGDWCRAHNCEYMGHVIEENNAHARLGGGTGHYFRSLWGQDFAGIDIVLAGLIPGIKGGSHAQVSRQFEAEDDFFYYMLAQMANSLAQIDEKKRGRSMCEIFGAYGWQEGLKEMKWLADFMISRGINTFVPHAFTPKAFPDPDCPPHFYAHGHNPQYRDFKRLMNHMNRLCEIVSDGKTVSGIAVLYYAEAEWASSNCMKTQEVVKFLTQRQYEPVIVPADHLENLSEAFKVIVVPTAEYLPAETMVKLGKLADRGVQVLFVDALPEKSSTQEINIAETLKNAKALSFDEIDAAVYEYRACCARGFEPDLKVYPYQKGTTTYVLLFNEGIHKALELDLCFKDARIPALYDPYEDRYEAVECEKTDCGVRVKLTLEVYDHKVLVFADEKAPEGYKMPACAKEIAWNGEFAASTATAEEYPAFTAKPEIKVGNLNRPDGMPRFSGTVRYENAFTAECACKKYVIDLGEVGETAEVWVNGVSAGVKICPPYRFDVSGFVKEGENAIAIDVTNTLVYQQHDALSMYHAIAPYGLIGPAKVYTEE